MVAISELTNANSDICMSLAVFPRPLSLLPIVEHDMILPLANCNSDLLFLNNLGFNGEGSELYIAFNLLNIALVDSSLWLNIKHTQLASVIA